MKTERFAIICVAVTLVLLVGIGLAALFILPNYVHAEEIDETANDSQIVSGYDQAKDQATQIVEDLSLKEYLSKYFDENLTDLIITIAVAAIAGFIFLGSVFFTIQKLIICIKKYGVESDATKEVMKSLTQQLSDTQKALTELESTKKLIEDNNEELRKAVSELAADNEKMQKVMKIAFGNDESLVARGYATQINEIIEEQ